MPDGQDRTVIGWRAWYTMGRRFDSETIVWRELPAKGMLAVRTYYRTKGRGRYLTGTTWYWLAISEGEEVYCNCDAKADAAFTESDVDAGNVKMGAWVSDRQIAEIVEELQQATEAPNEGARV